MIDDALSRASANEPLRVAVYDMSREDTPRMIAEVRFDGKKGSVEVLDQAFAWTLSRLFDQPHVRYSSVTLKSGAHAALPPEELEPWQPETLRYVLAVLFPTFKLSAELLSPDNRLDIARQRMHAYLAGTMDDPGYEDEDLLTEDAWLIECQDLAWLVKEMGRRELPIDRRQWVSSLLREPEHRRQVEQAISS
jgi:hypothetical protein